MGLAGFSYWWAFDRPSTTNGGAAGSDSLLFQELGLAVGANAIGCLHVFCLDQNGNLQHSQQSEPNGQQWTAWSMLLPAGPHPSPGLMPPISVVNYGYPLGVLQVFCVDDTGALWTCYELQPATPGNPSPQWSSLVQMADAGIVSEGFATITAAANADGHLEVFYVRQDGKLYHDWQVQPLEPAGPWNGPQQVLYYGLDGGNSTPYQLVTQVAAWTLIAATNANTTLELFAFGPIPSYTGGPVPTSASNSGIPFGGDGDPVNPNQGSGETSGRMSPARPRAAPAAQGGLHAPLHTWQFEPIWTGQEWSGVGVLAKESAGRYGSLVVLDNYATSGVVGQIMAAAAGATANGALEFFGVDCNGQLWHTIQDYTNPITMAARGYPPDNSGAGLLEYYEYGWGGWSTIATPRHCSITTCSLATSWFTVNPSGPAGPNEQLAPVIYNQQLVFSLAADGSGVQFSVGQSSLGSPGEVWNPEWGFSLGGRGATCLAVGVNSDQRSEVFIIVGGLLYHCWMLNPTLAPLGYGLG